MSTRVRLIKVQLQLVAVADDGESLTEVPIQPVEVSAADWPNVLELVAGGLSELEQRLNAED